MSSFTTKNRATHAKDVVITEDTLAVDLCDGRTIAVPLSWFPRLLHGSAKELSNWRLIGFGEGIHWPDLDEDISITGLLEGVPSRESQQSLQRWLENRGSVSVR